MAGREPEQWLWVLSHHLENREIDPISDADLLAYRDGQLDDGGRERIEWALTKNAATRARLIELAGGVEDRSVGPVRDRVLGAASPRPDTATPATPAAPSADPGTKPDETSPASSLERDRARKRRPPWLIPAAASLLLAITIPLWLWLATGSGSAVDLDRIAFAVRVEGLGDVRSTPDVATDIPAASAAPGTFVTIHVEPQQTVTDELRFTLYRLNGDRLTRIPEDAGIELQVSRGAARFRAEASALVPSTPGTHTIYVVVTASTPPRAVSDAASDPITALQQATGGKVYPCSIHLEGEPR